jgi:hypothetical protein
VDKPTSRASQTLPQNQRSTSVEPPTTFLNGTKHHPTVPYTRGGDSIETTPMSETTSALPVMKKVMPDGRTVIFQPIPVANEEEAKRLNKNSGFRASMMKDVKKLGFSMRNFSLAAMEVEEKPPKTLVIIWALMAAELVFDLATTMLAFANFLDTQTCCDYEIKRGPLPMSSTIPFFFLVVAEITFLF